MNMNINESMLHIGMRHLLGNMYQDVGLDEALTRFKTIEPIPIDTPDELILKSADYIINKKMRLDSGDTRYAKKFCVEIPGRPGYSITIWNHDTYGITLQVSSSVGNKRYPVQENSMEVCVSRYFKLSLDDLNDCVLICALSRYMNLGCGYDIHHCLFTLQHLRIDRANMYDRGFLDINKDKFVDDIIRDISRLRHIITNVLDVEFRMMQLSSAFGSMVSKLIDYSYRCHR